MDEQFKSHQYKEKLRQNIRGDQDMTETITTSSSKNIDKKDKKLVYYRNLIKPKLRIGIF